MSLKKFMHPRNRYRKIPDFKQLAILYPEFRNIAITDLSGKIKIDFKNETSLRALTEVLLKNDFSLDVKLPPNKLVPTLPLRLNYVLWIEDLMTHASFGDMEDVNGIDIGTGAVCIYPLLLAKIYGCHMVATEVDETSVQTAIQQVEKNNLQHSIKVLKVNGEAIFKDVVEDNKVYHFSMCNPPFFEVGGSSDKIVKQQPPRNAPTGNEIELTVEGGERAFVTQMIDESMEAKDKIKIYTTMFGRRSNLLFLLKLLKRRNIDNTTWTEFCQGHTKRWGLAWSFATKDKIDLTSAPVIRKSGDYIAKLLKEQRPTEIQFPIKDKFSSFEDLVNFLEDAMEELNVKIKELNLPIDDFNGWTCQLIAEKDTWSHARRKRRMHQRQMNEPATSGANNFELELTKDTTENVDEQNQIQISTKKSVVTEPLLVCNFFVELIENEEEFETDSIQISMVFEKGSGGRNALETFRQYLINKLNIREYVQKQSTRSSKKKRKRLKRSDSACESNVTSGKGESSSFENNVEVT